LPSEGAGGRRKSCFAVFSSAVSNRKIKKFKLKYQISGYRCFPTNKTILWKHGF